MKESDELSVETEIKLLQLEAYQKHLRESLISLKEEETPTPEKLKMKKKKKSPKKRK